MRRSARARGSIADATTAGLAFDAGERYQAGTAGQEFRRRTGVAVRTGIVDLAIGNLVEANAGSDFDAHVGSMGDTLARSGYNTAVIANADEGPLDGSAATIAHREAAAALMRSDGTLRGGDVSGDLLRADVDSPFGTRLAPDAVLRAFDRAWHGRAVVLVEASDLARAEAYASDTTSAQATAQLRTALLETDRIVGELLARVDASKDAVLVVTPSHTGSADALGVAALRTPSTRFGYLRSATTGRDGYVSLVDVAPTILNTVGVSVPTSMEGEPMLQAGAEVSLQARRAHLVQGNRDGMFRDQLVDPVQTTYATLAELIALGVALLVVSRRHGSALRFAGLVLLGYPTVTYFIVPLHLEDRGGVVAFWALVGAGSFAFALLCLLVGRRTKAGPVICALGLVVGVHLVDALVAQRLEFNTPFGYSTTVGIRLAGIGNQTFAQLGAAAVLLAGYIASRSRGRNLALGLLAVTLVALVAPPFGQNFGAALALAPTIALFAWLTAGRRLRVRHIVAVAAAALVVALAVGFLDLSRPPSRRTHIGRFFAQVGNQGWSGFATVIHRKAAENLQTFSNTGWVVLVLCAVALFVFLALGPSRSLEALRANTTARSVAVSLATLFVLGDLFKDSGIAVTAMMVGVTIAVLPFAPVLCSDDPPESSPSFVSAPAATPALENEGA